MDLFLCSFWVDGNYYDFIGNIFFFQMNCFFNCDFVEWVYCYFDVGEINIGVVWFDVYFYVVVDYLFYSDQNFYRFFVFL